MDANELRKEYRALRGKHLLTLREASNLLGIDVTTLSLIENGPAPELEFEEFEAEVWCHECNTEFRRRPLKGMVFAHYVCDECAKNRNDEGSST